MKIWQKKGNKFKWSWQAGLLLLLLLLSGVVAGPVWAASRGPQRMARPGATSLNATIYLTTATLKPMFQDRINQQVPGAVSSAITQIVNTMPAANRGWAQQMASSLIQPSATLTSLTPQQDGLAAKLRVSLYPGDPQPIDSSMLVKFSALNSSTIQVSAQPMKGSPALVNGPLTTMPVPMGQLNGVSSTPNCGDAALAVKLQVPVSLGSASTMNQPGAAVVMRGQAKEAAQNVVSAYVEIPASALSSLGGNIGKLPIDTTFTASNIRVSTQGSDLVVTSDILWGTTTIRLATATSYLQPTAVGGNLAVQVEKTNVTVLSFITFKDDAYNKQIEQTLNTKLNGMLAGKFTVNSAAIGANTHVSCAASGSLLLSGNASMG